jgi:hypothetical protein
MGQEAWEKERRGTRAKYSHLYNRTSALLEWLEKFIEPELQTVRKARYDEVVQPVKNLVKWRLKP